MDSDLDSFVVRLPSSVRPDTNTTANYVTNLKDPIVLDGEWNVGLREFIYTYRWHNIEQDSPINFIIYGENWRVAGEDYQACPLAQFPSLGWVNFHSKFDLKFANESFAQEGRWDVTILKVQGLERESRKQLVIPAGNYKTKENILKAFNDAMSKAFDGMVFAPPVNRGADLAFVRKPQIEFTTHEFLDIQDTVIKPGIVTSDVDFQIFIWPLLTDELCKFLGFSYNPIRNIYEKKGRKILKDKNFQLSAPLSLTQTLISTENKKPSSSTKTSISNSHDFIYVYCDVVAESHIGDVKANVIGVVEVPSPNLENTVIAHKFTNPIFARVAHNNIRSIEVHIKFDNNKSVPFAHGDSYVLLVLEFKRAKTINDSKKLNYLLHY